ncbi:MAG TPA: hypothetical protein PKN86_21665, partial [Candidatus Obscuribacter sp.]|nr:hypothetical protein [Candidatus Obscuribacter sp.]
PAANVAKLQVAVQGYEMQTKDAAAILGALPAKIDSKAFLLQVASLAGPVSGSQCEVVSFAGGADPYCLVFCGCRQQ